MTPRPLRPRRLAALRVLLHPRAAVRLLDALAAEAAIREHACHVLIRACAEVHHSPPWRR